jgi:hypothetical protein
VKAAAGPYVALPDTIAVPTVVPALVQSVGGEDCGPNTVKVIVPDGPAPPDNDAATDDAAIADPAIAADGALTDTPGDAAPTRVSEDPHDEVAALLFGSPSYLAYHQ